MNQQNFKERGKLGPTSASPRREAASFNQAMNAEPPTTRLHVESQPSRPGYRQLSKKKMKNISSFLVLLFLMINCGESEYSEVQEKDLGGVFIINSSPTFQGYYYEGSDQEFHYFSIHWKYEGDRKMKIARSDLEIAKEFQFGSDMLGLTLLNVPDSGPIFCEIDGRPVYEKEKNR